MTAFGRHALVLALILVPRLAFAQGSITGTVKDPSGAVLPGVTVEAASDVLIEKLRTVTTDGTGQYRIVDLRPGLYTVTFTLPGFTTFKREGVELTGSFTATINAEMKVGALEETVTVSGESPVVDVQNTRRETVINSSVIETLPATRAYGAVLNAMAGVTVDNNGLAATPTMTFFSAHGGRTNEGRMTINGMTVAAAFNGGGVSSLTYDTNNVEEVSVLVSGGLGENETGGPTMNLVPRSGGNKFSGQAFFNTAGKWSAGDNIDDALRSIGITTPPAIINSYDGSGSFGGPIKPDRLWFYGSYLPARRQHRAAQRPGAQHLVGAIHRAGDAAKPRDLLPRESVPLRGVDAHDERQGLPDAQRRVDGARLDHAVARGEYRLLRFPLLGDPGDVDLAADQQGAVRGRLLALRVPPRRRSRATAARRHLQLDPRHGAVGDRRSPRQFHLSRSRHVPGQLR